MHIRRSAVPGSTPAATALLAAAVAAAAFLGAGCSDDVTCPEICNIEPFISGGVAEFGGDRAEWTSVEIFCSSDPLTVEFAVFVNDTPLEIGPASGYLGRVATLDGDQVMWAPGTSCSLHVVTDYGFAHVSTHVPGQFQVTAPAEVSLGDALTLEWDSSDHADYYVVSAVLQGDGSAEALLDTVTVTTVSYSPEQIGMAGEFTGHVVAVSGPLPVPGIVGNVNGAGWGFFAASYYDRESEFSVTITEGVSPGAGHGR